MPDVWTFAPEKLRTALEKQGATCGVEPRVLKPRDPEWTCHVYSAPMSYDIYIHSAYDQLTDLRGVGAYVVLALCFGILSGLWWGRYFWRTGRESRR